MPGQVEQVAAVDVDLDRWRTGAVLESMDLLVRRLNPNFSLELLRQPWPFKDLAELEGKVTLIAGGARGHGAAEGKLFAREGAKALQEKIERYKPRIVCFVGLTGDRVCCGSDGSLGRRPDHFADAQVFVVPSTSPRNARYSLEKIVAALRDLQEYRDALDEQAGED
ncbi:MAG: hypothetical protein HYZ72_20935 [Deltaproteobacteria bacterium]|nr:hypothetical protein [Deltaproteobacteria bacterium]